jgi:hypothetical protein
MITPGSSGRKAKRTKKEGEEDHIVSHAVPSALKSLTSVFGMGTGGTSSLWPPKKAIKQKLTIEIAG